MSINLEQQLMAYSGAGEGKGPYEPSQAIYFTQSQAADYVRVLISL
jgi:hypothetical protein